MAISSVTAKISSYAENRVSVSHYKTNSVAKILFKVFCFGTLLATTSVAETINKDSKTYAMPESEYRSSDFTLLFGLFAAAAMMLGFVENRQR